MNLELVKKIIEAALMVSGRPLTLSQLLELFDQDGDRPEKADIRAALTELQSEYADRGAELKEVASGFRFQVKSEYARWVNRLYDERTPRYSRALLETLAIIAYRQPITRGEIEDIRGVSVNANIIKTMQEREWIRVVGYRDVPGRPELLATTKQFLDYFNLKKLSDLPTLAEIKDYDQLNPDLFATVKHEAGDDPVVRPAGNQNAPGAGELPDNILPFSG
jgi:segregation and condensation protein B